MEEISNNGNSVLKLEGRIDLSNYFVLGDKLQDFYEKGCHSIILDFSLLTSIDSLGLGQLLLFNKKLKKRDGELKIINVTSRYIREMFETIQLDKIITIKPGPALK